MTNSSPSVSSASSRPMVGDSVSFTQLFDLYAKELPHTAALLISTMPRGGLQIVQPQRVSEPLLRSYLRDYGVQDRVVWNALVTGKATKSSRHFTKADIDGTYFMTRFLRPNGFLYYAAAPVPSAVFNGYPGVLWVGRTQEQGDFTDAELATLERLAGELSGLLRETRAARLPKSFDATLPWLHDLSEKFFLFDEKLRQVLPAKTPQGLDGVLHDHMLRQARIAIEQVKAKQEVPERALLPDAEGDLWTFHVAAEESIPALGEGAYVMLTLQPQAADWITLSNVDFAADSELSRLMPAVRYMSKEFRSSPTLNDIAKFVHLSPFHFHRRFTELLGLTPKHFLLECQIHEAKTELVSKNKPLPALATDTGFAHQSHFTSRFKQTTGLTPTRWRRLAARRSMPESQAPTA